MTNTERMRRMVEWGDPLALEQMARETHRRAEPWGAMAPFRERVYDSLATEVSCLERALAAWASRRPCPVVAQEVASLTDEAWVAHGDILGISGYRFQPALMTPVVEISDAAIALLMGWLEPPGVPWSALWVEALEGDISRVAGLVRGACFGSPSRELAQLETAHGAMVQLLELAEAAESRDFTAGFEHLDPALWCHDALYAVGSWYWFRHPDELFRDPPSFDCLLEATRALLHPYLGNGALSVMVGQTSRLFNGAQVGEAWREGLCEVYPALAQVPSWSWSDESAGLAQLLPQLKPQPELIVAVLRRLFGAGASTD